MKNKDLYGKIAPGELYRVKGIRLLSDATKEQIELKIGKPEAIQPLLKYFHLFDKAHLTMLSEEGIIPKQDAAKSLSCFAGNGESGCRGSQATGWPWYAFR